MSGRERNYNLTGITDADIELFVPLVNFVIRTRYYVGEMSYEEKFNAGLMGVACGLRRYEAKKATTQKRWLYYYIDAYIRNEAEKEYRQKRRVVLGLVDDFQLSEKAQMPQDVMEWKELGCFRRHFRFLDKRTKRIVYLVCVENYTYTEIAKLEKLSAVRIGQIYKNGLSKLRRVIERGK